MEPRAPERDKIQLTVSRETYQKLRRAQDLLRHSVPDGDPAVIVERALTLLVTQLERTKTGATERPRKGARASKTGSRHIPAAIKRHVWQRDGGRCAFDGPEGRCPTTGFLEYHHVVPFAAGGQTTNGNIELRCRAHNLYEAERYFGPAHLPMMREARAVFGTSPQLVPERAAPELGGFLFVAHEGNPPNGACDNRFGLSVELHAESDVDAVQLEETATHRCAREMHARVHGKKSPAAHQNFGAPAVHDDDFVSGVARLDEEGLRLVDLVDLQAIRPIKISPSVEISCCGTNNAAH
jgi:5-methylcytosine-specific restriction endonuclease McrA